ncbi:hypothetical protein CEW92_05685 [Bacillaceae bacterium SAS-127]|nr:hypothetical protein CEW92_05685 [Bacillaceae bacterium SAS-127]
MKTAILHNGYSFHSRFFQLEEYQSYYNDILSLRCLHQYDLDQYDVLIIPARMTPRLLLRYQALLLNFFKKGKTVIVFGEVVDRWLPKVEWKHIPVNFSWWVEKGGDLPLELCHTEHSIFQYITMQDVKWHYHGTLQPPAEAISLVNTPDGRSIFYIDEHTYGGRLIMTTLDPIFHLGLGFIDQAKDFFPHLMQWLKNECE